MIFVYLTENDTMIIKRLVNSIAENMLTKGHLCHGVTWLYSHFPHPLRPQLPDGIGSGVCTGMGMGCWGQGLVGHLLLGLHPDWGCGMGAGVETGRGCGIERGPVFLGLALQRKTAITLPFLPLIVTVVLKHS